MTDSSRDRRKKKITYIASEEGVAKAENALMRLGFESKSNFANSQLISRSTATKFFQCQPIQLDSFKRICDALKLNWKEVAELPEKKQLNPLKITDCSKSVINEEGEMIETNRRQVIVIDKESKTVKAQITLEGDINSVNNDLSVTLELCLRTYSGHTIRVTDIQEGSIKLIIEGSQEDVERLVERIQSGEITELSGFPVEDTQILGKNSDDAESNEPDNKWHLVQEIRRQGANGRNLSSANLSDTDLSGVDLSDADLSGADLSNADLSNADLSNAYLSSADLSDADLSDANLISAYLSGANLNLANLNGANLRNVYLRFANLRRADLSDANLRRADLSDANLSGADLSGADLSSVNVERTQFKNNLGITKKFESDLIRRGAILEDSVPDDKRFDNKIFPDPNIKQRTYTVQNGGTIVVLLPSGVLDATRSQEFREFVIASISEHTLYIVVNLERVTFMDSSGLGALVLAFKTTRASGKKMVICSIKEQVKILFELTGMDEVFEIFDTEKEAVGDTYQIYHYNFTKN